MGFQPVIVPVGRVGLGRIFNVVGAVVDPYMDSGDESLHTPTPLGGGGGV